MVQRIAFLFFAGFFLAACNKDADVMIAGTGDNLLRIKTANGDMVTEFSYDNNGRLAKFSSWTGGAKSSETERSYNEAGKLAKESFSVNLTNMIAGPLSAFSYSEYSYDGNGRLSETKVYSKSSGGSYQYTSRVVPGYDAAGRLVSITSFDVTGNPYAKITYQYNAKDNVTGEDQYVYNGGTQTPSRHIGYEHDDKKNPFENIWVMPWGANKNNITKITGTDFTTAPGMPTGTNVNVIIIKSYTTRGYPAIAFENGADRYYEYQGSN